MLYSHIPNCCPREGTDLCCLLFPSWYVWWTLMQFKQPEKVTSLARLQCSPPPPPQDAMFYFSLSLLSVPDSTTRGSPWLPLIQGTIFTWDKVSLHETFRGLSGGLWSLEWSVWKPAECMCEWEALHTGGMWPKFNLSIVRMEGLREKKRPCLLKSHWQCCNAGV